MSTVCRAVTLPPEGGVTDLKALREAFGRFATGVTIVTTRDSEGRPLGLTANSFTSVSLEPPLVLWSLARSSQNLQAYRSADRFAINVLSCEQHELCHRFAGRSGDDRFGGVDLAPSDCDLPLLVGALAQFECFKWAEYEVGDHVVFIGRVERFSAAEGEALIFNSGRLYSGRELVHSAIC